MNKVETAHQGSNKKFCRNSNCSVINLTHNVEHEFFSFHTHKECKKQKITLTGKQSVEHTVKIDFGLEALGASLSEHKRLMLVSELAPWTSSKVKTDTYISRT